MIDIKKVKKELTELVGTRDGNIVEEVSKSQIEDFKLEHYKNIAGNYTKEAIEESISSDTDRLEEVKDNAEAYDALMSLIENDSFMSFVSYYFICESSRLTELLTQAQPYDNGTKNELISKLDSIRHFKLFLKALTANGIEASEDYKMKKINISILNSIIENDDFKKEEE